MTRKKIKEPKKDIEFTLDGVDGPVEYSLIPMTQRTAAHVFHNVLANVMAALGEALAGMDDKSRMGAIVARLKDNVEFDEMWFILTHMMKNAMVDDDEVGDLDTSDVFDDNPHHMYLVAYHGIKENWPALFFQMEAKFAGLASKIKQTMAGMTEPEKEKEKITDQ